MSEAPLKSKASQLRLQPNAKAPTVAQYKQHHSQTQQQALQSLRNVYILFIYLFDEFLTVIFWLFRAQVMLAVARRAAWTSWSSHRFRIETCRSWRIYFRYRKRSARLSRSGWPIVATRWASWSPRCTSCPTCPFDPRTRASTRTTATLTRSPSTDASRNRPRIWPSGTICSMIVRRCWCRNMPRMPPLLPEWTLVEPR